MQQSKVHEALDVDWMGLQTSEPLPAELRLDPLGPWWIGVGSCFYDSFAAVSVP